MPPVATIELSQWEPIPPGVVETVRWGEYGGGGDDVDNSNRVRWTLFPDDIYNNMEACGFGNRNLSQAVLELPSGTHFDLPTQTDGGCWSYDIGWEYGMELGEYTVSLDHPNGSLEYSWEINYPEIPTLICYLGILTEGRLQALLMGFSSRENITLHFYSLQSGNQGYYITSRTVRADEHGSVYLDVSTTRSSDFRQHPVGMIVDGYGGEGPHADPACFPRHLYPPDQMHLGWPQAIINDVWVQYDIEQDQEYGMLIHVNFEAINMRGVMQNLWVNFYYDNGEPLKDFDDQYDSFFGDFVATNIYFTPRYVHSTYDDVEIFMPYSQLHLESDASYDLMFQIEIYPTTSDPVYFNIITG